MSIQVPLGYLSLILYTSTILETAILNSKVWNRQKRTVNKSLMQAWNRHNI